MFRLIALLPMLLLAGLAGCATHGDRVRQARLAYEVGDIARAETLLEESLQRRGAEKELLQLESAVIQLAAGRPREAEQRLRHVRDQFDYLEQSSAVEATLTMLSDDQRRAYAGEDYEKVLVRALLALSNLLHSGGDAEAYSLQIAEKQQQIIESGVDSEGNNPKGVYQQVALGPYLRGALREATHRDYDDAARNWATVVHWEPQFASGQQHLERALHGRHSERGHGVVYVFALVGRGPLKQEVAEVPSSAALLVADRILSGVLKHELPPTIAPIKIPRVVASRSRVDHVQVILPGGTAAGTETITDVTRMALHQHHAVETQVMARAVARRMVKKGTIYGAKEALGMARGSLATIPLDLAGIAWEATERADTRCWAMLPSSIQVVRIELPAGEHELDLLPVDRQGRGISTARRQTVSIENGRNTYVLLHVPESRIVGEVLANTP
jgi:uncharacterized protein